MSRKEKLQDKLDTWEASLDELDEKLTARVRIENETDPQMKARFAAMQKVHEGISIRYKSALQQMNNILDKEYAETRVINVSPTTRPTSNLLKSSWVEGFETLTANFSQIFFPQISVSSISPSYKQPRSLLLFPRTIIA